MRFDDLLTFSFIDGIGEKTLKKLRGVTDINDLFMMDDKELAEYLPSKKVISTFRSSFCDYIEKMHHFREKLAADGALIVSIDNSAYPERLLSAESFPVFLYCRGNLDLINYEKTAAISGPRQASRDGLETSFNTAKALASKNAAVISGLAIGIDAAAHKGACREGKTIAVLPCYSPVYPSQNQYIYDLILKNNGLIIAEYREPTNIKFQLLSRDRIIVNLSDRVYVPDSYASDSGTSYTVDYARSRKKPVYVYCNGKYVKLREEP